MRAAIDTFSSLLKEVDLGTLSFGNPVSDFGVLESPNWPHGKEHVVSVPPESSNELGLLDYSAVLEEGAQAITSIVSEVGDRLNRLTPDITSTTEQFSAKNVPSTKERLRLVRDLASILDREASWLLSANKRYKTAMEDMSNALNSMLSGEFELEADGKKSLQEFVDVLRLTEQQAIKGRDQFLSLANVMDSLPRIERDFGRANRMFSAEIKEFVGNIDQTISVFTRARNAASLLMAKA